MCLYYFWSFLQEKSKLHFRAMNKFTIQCTGKTELLHTNEIHSLLLFCLFVFKDSLFLSDKRSKRSNINSFDKRCLQRNVKLLQGLQHSNQRIHKSMILYQCYVFIHLCCNRAVCKQGDPVMQKVVSDKVVICNLETKIKPS